MSIYIEVQVFGHKIEISAIYVSFCDRVKYFNMLFIYCIPIPDSQPIGEQPLLIKKGSSCGNENEFLARTQSEIAASMESSLPC
jgi:hypothetical protein